MKITKYFEVRDRATFIPVMATRLGSENEQEQYLLTAAGYGNVSEQFQYTVVTRLNGLHSGADVYDWEGRTMRTAHQYIHENFYKMIAGEVVDVEYILGEVNEPKTTQNKGGVIW